MKKIIFTSIILLFGISLYSQTGPRRSIVAILPFEAGTGVSASDAQSLQSQLVSELRSWDALDILKEAQGSEYIIRGRLERVNNQYVLSAATSESNTNRTLNNSREQAATLTDLSSQIFSFAAQVTENVPFPNYFLGKWMAQIQLEDGPLTCIVEFRADRRLVVEQFDTWERRGEFSLRYQGFGTGTYTFWGHARRTRGGGPVDGFITVNFNLDDALPKYENISYTRMNYNFNESRSVFQLVGSGFGCGDVYQGDSDNVTQHHAYITFTKIN